MNFGKLSSDDLQLFLALADEFDKEFIEAQDILIHKRDQLFAADCLKPSWSHLYELPILQHVAQGFPNNGVDFMRQMAESTSQIQFAKGVLDSFDAELDAWEPNEVEKDEIRKQLAAIFAFSYSLMQSFRSLKVFGLYLNDLVAVVRDGGERAKKALLAAVKIDRTVLACPSINAYVSQRVLLNDEKFLKKLRGAECGNLNRREQRNYQRVRLVLQTLQEVGAKRLSSGDLYQLFVDELNLMAGDRNDDVGNVAENLRQFAYQFMKQNAVS
jgi:hypothetical protein